MGNGVLTLKDIRFLFLLLILWKHVSYKHFKNYTTSVSSGLWKIIKICLCFFNKHKKPCCGYYCFKNYYKLVMMEIMQGRLLEAGVIQI